MVFLFGKKKKNGKQNESTEQNYTTRIQLQITHLLQISICHCRFLPVKCMVVRFYNLHHCLTLIDEKLSASIFFPETSLERLVEHLSFWLFDIERNFLLQLTSERQEENKRISFNYFRCAFLRQLVHDHAHGSLFWIPRAPSALTVNFKLGK